MMFRAELRKQEQETVSWKFLLEMMAGFITVKMAYFILLMPPSVCSLGAISLRSYGWPILTVEIKWL